MAKSSRGGRRAGGEGLKASDILSERDMIVERGEHMDSIDDVLTVSRDFLDEYGDAVPLEQFLIAELKPGVSAIAYFDGANIAVNQKYLDGGKLAQAYAHDVSTGFHPSNGNKSAMAAVAAHEFGHAATQAVGGKLKMSLDDAAAVICKEARKKTGHRGVVQMARKISGYAAQSNAEAIAEAVSDVYCNGRKARKESRAIVDVMNSYLK